MKIKSCYILFALTLVSTLGFSQHEKRELTIIITANFNGESIEKEAWYVTKNKDSIQFSQLKFYLTDFIIRTQNGEKDAINNSNFLVDVFEDDTTKITFSDMNINKQEQLIFSLGVHENLNTSGANAGDLDPSKGMFWSWQSGYINFKIEGYSPSCKTRKNKFQFHIGGYQKPYETIRNIAFNLDAIENNTLTINFDVSQFFDVIELSSQNQIMIPGKEANAIADQLPKLFSIRE